MIFHVEWTPSAQVSFLDEVDFIYLKWNYKEVLKFQDLVEIETARLAINPEIGKLKSNGTYSLVLSKQTTLYYRIKPNNNLVELLYFWNNLKNPDDLVKLLHK